MGAQFLPYSKEPELDRAFFDEVLTFWSPIVIGRSLPKITAILLTSIDRAGDCIFPFGCIEVLSIFSVPVCQAMARNE